MILRKFGRIFGVAGVLVFYSLVSPNSQVSLMAQETKTTAAQAAYAHGKILFKANCSFCHGSDATGGNGGPDLIRSVLVNHDENGNLIAPTVRNGRPEKGMPAFSSLTDAEIADIVSFLHQENIRLRIRSGYKVGNVLTGNVTAGKAYFQAHCSRCHSVTDDLEGVAKRYDPDQLQQLWLDPADRGNDDEDLEPVKTVNIETASGQKFSGNLVHRDEFNISWIDANGYHSLPIENGVVVQVHDPLAAHDELLKHLTDADVHNVTTYLETLK